MSQFCHVIFAEVALTLFHGLYVGAGCRLGGGVLLVLLLREWIGLRALKLHLLADFYAMMTCNTQTQTAPKKILIVGRGATGHLAQTK